MEENEAPWQTEADDTLEQLDDEDVEHMFRPAKRPLEIVPAATDDPGEVQEAIEEASRLNRLRELRQQAADSRVPGAVFQIDRELRQLERGCVQKDGSTADLNQVLRRNLDAHFEAEAKVIQAKRKENFQLARIRRRVQAQKARKNKEEEEEEEKAKKKHLKDKIDMLPKEYTMKALGANTKEAAKLRRAMFDKLKLLSPPLSFEAEHHWPRLLEKYLAKQVRKFNVAVGGFLIDKVNGAIAALGEHYRGKSKNKKEGKGDPEAFAKLYSEMEADLPKSAKSVTL